MEKEQQQILTVKNLQMFYIFTWKENAEKNVLSTTFLSFELLAVDFVMLYVLRSLFTDQP